MEDGYSDVPVRITMHGKCQHCQTAKTTTLGLFASYVARTQEIRIRETHQRKPAYISHLKVVETLEGILVIFVLV